MGRTILYFHTGSSSFVDKDIRIFEEIAPVFTFAFTVRNKKQTPWFFIKQLLFLIRHLKSSRLLVCQFSGYHSFLPALCARLFSRRCLIISGGTDCHNFPGIRYGNFQKGILSWFTSMSFRLCDHIALKHETLWHCNYSYDRNEPSVQGILAILPELKTPHSSIPNGYESANWSAGDGSTRRIKTFITVTGGLQFPFQRQLKGIDLILKVAPSFPECEFTILGVPESQHWSDVPDNVRLLPPGSQRVIHDEFQRHAFYLQLSMAEGFPNALCEAMLCGCIPIGSSVFSIPEIIGENGYLLPERNTTALKSVIHKALMEYDPVMGEKAAQSIRNRFPLERRKNELKALCLRLLS